MSQGILGVQRPLEKVYSSEHPPLSLSLSLSISHIFSLFDMLLTDYLYVLAPFSTPLFFSLLTVLLSSVTSSTNVFFQCVCSLSVYPLPSLFCLLYIFTILSVSLSVGCLSVCVLSLFVTPPPPPPRPICFLSQQPLVAKQLEIRTKRGGSSKSIPYFSPHLLYFHHSSLPPPPPPGPCIQPYPSACPR